MTLTVEDGTGLPNADAYEDAAATAARLALLGHTVFDGLVLVAQEPIIRRETGLTDTWLSTWVSGRRRNEDQARLYPRHNSWPRAGREFDSDERPAALLNGIALRCEARAANKILDQGGAAVIERGSKNSKVKYAKPGRSFADEVPEAYPFILQLMDVS